MVCHRSLQLNETNHLISFAWYFTTFLWRHRDNSRVWRSQCSRNSFSEPREAIIVLQRFVAQKRDYGGRSDGSQDLSSCTQLVIVTKCHLPYFSVAHQVLLSEVIMEDHIWEAFKTSHRLMLVEDYIPVVHNACCQSHGILLYIA